VSTTAHWQIVLRMSYAGSMTTRPVAFRLTDDELATLDRLAAEGVASDRTASMKVLIAREARRQAAERDAMIYAKSQPDDDLDSLARWAADHVPSLD
jgi:hypothetical protein